MDLIVDIYVECPGDESVGIFSQTWELKEITIVPELREKMRKATKEYFESYIAGELCNVYFSDEIDAMNKQYEPDEVKEFQ